MRRETYFPRLATSCHNAKVVHVFEPELLRKFPAKLRATPSSIAHAAPSDVSLPAVSSLGGLRTPAPSAWRPSSWAGIRKPSQKATLCLSCFIPACLRPEMHLAASAGPAAVE